MMCIEFAWMHCCVLLYLYVYICFNVHTTLSLHNTFPFIHIFTILSAFCLVVSTQRGTRPVSAPVFSQAALAEAGIPMTPFDQPQTSTPIKIGRQEERRLEVTVEAVEPSKIEAAAEVKVFNFSIHYFTCLWCNFSRSLKVYVREKCSIIHVCKPSVLQDNWCQRKINKLFIMCPHSDCRGILKYKELF